METIQQTMIKELQKLERRGWTVQEPQNLNGNVVSSLTFALYLICISRLDFREACNLELSKGQ